MGSAAAVLVWIAIIGVAAFFFGRWVAGAFEAKGRSRRIGFWMAFLLFFAFPVGPMVALAISWAVRPVGVPAIALEPAALVAASATPTVPQVITVNQSPGAADALRNLNKLKDDGLVTDEEYEAKRAEILARL